MKLHPCPCCGYATLKMLNDDEICNVCWWHDDGQDNVDADEVRGGPNSDLSLTQARINFLEQGISCPDRLDLIDKADAPSDYKQMRFFKLSQDGKIIEKN